MNNNIEIPGIMWIVTRDGRPCLYDGSGNAVTGIQSLVISTSFDCHANKITIEAIVNIADSKEDMLNKIDALKK
jgi:hypothetical protein